VQPANGTVSLNPDGSFAYIPNPNFSGSDSYSYRISDGKGGSTVANVNISVGAINDAPIAVNDLFSVATNTTLTITGLGVLFNDSNGDGDNEPISVAPQTVTGSSGGQITLNADGSLTYIPFPNTNYIESFTYTLLDGAGNTTTAMMKFDVGNGNDTPIAANDNYSTTEDNALTITAKGVLTNDTDPDDGNNSNLAAILATAPTNGTLTLDANGSFVYVPNRDFFGSDTFTYNATDANGAKSIATVTISVTAVNDAPIALNDNASTNEDTSIAFDLSLNDNDKDGTLNKASIDLNPLTTTEEKTLTIANQGTYTADNDGVVTFVPVLNFNGTATAIAYTIKDNQGLLSNSAVLTITVNSVNDAPVSAAESYTVAEDGILNVPSSTGVLANDNDVHGEAIVSVLNTAANGVLKLNTDGSFSYTPNADFTGTDSFTYQACDGNGGCSTPTLVTLTVSAVNDAPIALADSYTGVEDVTLNIPAATGLLLNDSDTENSPLTVTLAAPPANGTVTLNTNGSFIYIPNANYNGGDNFTYTLSDGQGGTATGIVNLIVDAVNDAPIAQNDAYSLVEDNILTITAPGLLANDSDIDGDLVFVNSVVTPPAHGRVTLNSNGRFVYSPNMNFNGSDSYTYRLDDGKGGSAIATVSLTITAQNDQPSPQDDNYSAIEDQPLIIPAANGLLFNDTDTDEDVLSVSVLFPPTNGTLTLATNGSFTYAPNANYHGSDQFTYTVTDVNGGSSSATVNIQIAAVNDIPLGGTDLYTTLEDVPLVIVAPGLLSNDTDVDGDKLTASAIAAPPLHGIVTLDTDGRFRYVPNANYSGTDSFTYLLDDHRGGTTNVLVNLTVTTVNDAPQPQDDSYTAIEDTPLAIAASAGLLFNDEDPENNTLTATLASQPANGTVSVNANGSFTYTPSANYNGPDSFTYRVSDGNGGETIATVNLMVMAINDAPIAVNDNYTITEDNILTIQAAGVLVNDTDADADVLLTKGIVNPPQNGEVTLNANGRFVYVPNVNFHGTDSFTYTIDDNRGGTSVATVNIAVTAVNDDPIARDDEFIVTTNVTLNISGKGVLFNDSNGDEAGNPEAITASPQTAVTGSKGGTLTLNANGSLTYVPAPNLSYIETFTYFISDAGGNTSRANAVFVVGSGNDAPIAANDAYSTAEDVTLIVPVSGVLVNDTDPDNGEYTGLASILVSGTSNGQLTLNENGSFMYVPNNNFTGSDTFTYNATDANGAISLATVTITVSPVNDAPVAANNNVSTNEDTPVTISILANDTDVDGTLDPATIDLDPTTAAVEQTLTIPGEGTYAVTGTTVTFTPVSNFNGQATAIRYTVKDNNDLMSNTATILVTVTPVNDAPVAQTDAYTLAEDGVLNVSPANGVLSNDSDIDGEAIVSLLGVPTRGTLDLNRNGSFTYVPNANFSGTDSFTYQACDANGACSAVTTVTITVSPVNDAPVAVNNSAITNEDTPVVINILANDSDVDGTLDAATIDLEPTTPAVEQTLTIPGEGSYSVTGTTVTFSPVANFNGQATPVSYTVKDSNGLISNIASILVTVTPINDAPVAQPDTYTVAEDVVLNISAINGVLANDSDIDGEAIVSALSAPTSGTLDLNRDGSFTYAPNINFSGTDSFTYQACDASGACSVVTTVTITVSPVNDAPVAVNNTISTNEGTPVAISVLANDTDVDGTLDPATMDLDPTTAVIEQTLTIFGEGTYTVTGTTLTFTPVANFNGQATAIRYTVKDNDGLVSNNATIAVTVTPVNDAPIAQPDTYTTNEDLPLSIDAPGVVFNDSDPDNNALTTAAATQPQKGILTLNSGGGFLYTPNANFNGTDSFTYTVSDGQGGLSTANVNITVLSINDIPDALNDAVSTAEDTAVSLAITSNDTDIDGTIDATSVDLDPFTNGIQTSIVTAQGTWTVDDTGKVTFTPATNFNGIATKIYTIDDNDSATSLAATITITVTPVNDAPFANDDVATTPEDVAITFNIIANDNDVEEKLAVQTIDLDPSTAGIQSTFVTANGTWKTDGLGNVIFDPAANFNGTAKISYTVSDNEGLASNVAQLTVTVSDINDAPMAVNDQTTINEDNNALIRVLDNDFDVDGVIIASSVDLDPATQGIQKMMATTQGTWMADQAGTVTFVPAVNFNGVAAINYLVLDDTGTTSNLAVISVIVNDLNDAPLTLDDFASTAGTTAVTFNIVSNDTDVDGTIVSNSVDLDPAVAGIQKTMVTAQGSWSADNLGNVSFTANANFTGAASIPYLVSDNDATLSNIANLTVNVSSVNTAPVAVNDSFATPANTALTASVLANDSDPEGNALTVATIAQPVNGTLSFNGVGTFTYVPNSGFIGTDSFTYRICDNGAPSLCSQPATVSIIISANNVAPIAVADVASTTQNIGVNGNVLTNDSDPDGNTLSVSIATQPANGTVILNANGAYQYTPRNGFSGTDSFTYQLCDNGTPSLCAKATVTITISVNNIAPIAVADVASTTQNIGVSGNVLTNDSDPDGNTLSASIATQPANGTVILNANGTYQYTPRNGFSGTDSFTYQLCDNGTPSLCATATVTITISVNNIAPIAIADIASTTQNTGVSGNVLTNDSDPDGNTLSASIATQPANGTVVLNANGTYQYMPRNGFSGTDSFTYQLCDNGTPSLCATATVTITISVNNAAPIAFADLVSTTQNIGVSGNVLTNDSDPDGNTLSASIASQPANGIVVLNTDGTYQYTPRNGFSGTDSFTYQVCDNGSPSLCATANVTITVSPLPKPVIGIAKLASQVKRMSNGSYNILYTINLRNYGTMNLTNVQVEDNLRQAFPSPAIVTVVGLPVVTGKLVANNEYNGSTVSSLLNSSSSLAVGASETIEITVNVLTENVSKTYLNTATASAAGNGMTTSDVSTDGVNPDPDHNQDPTEANPTPVMLTENKLFIPKGFSPNGDGINDQFIIENAGNQRIHLEVYNRWGNLVFKNVDYKNEWEGTTNVGIRLGDVLPDGTYYYIVNVGGQKYVSYLTINR
jgi:gliding motility-associated-like protein